MSSQNFSLEYLSQVVQGKFLGQPDFLLRGLASLEHADAHQLSFVNGEKYIEQAKESKAGALIVTSEIQGQLPSHHNFIIVDNPYLAFAILTHIFERKHIQIGIEATAQIHPTAIISDSAHFGFGP